EIIESQNVSAVGADDFLTKPFHISDLISKTKTIFELPQEKPMPAELPEDEYSYCKIHVDEFTSSSTLMSDIFVKLTGGKFVKVAHEGSDIPVSRIQTYKQKKVDFFYVKVADFQKY